MDLKQGIILKAVKYQENHKIITVLTPDGIDALLVRGALNQKSKTFAYAQELTKIEFGYVAKYEQTLKILTAGKIVDNYSQIKIDFSKLNDALLMIELTDQLGVHIEDSATFYHFCDDILRLINVGTQTDYYLVIFKLKALYLLGVGPVFTSCVSCGTRGRLVGFDFTAGGMKCDACHTTGDYFVPAELVAIAKFLYLTKLPDITPEVLTKLPDRKTVMEFIDRYYDYYLGYRSRAGKIINKMN
ncbi:MAG: DNA repair protein RecO [Bacilli bacterium]|nr:DNA repair protein RecO [Bacilli bacterium]MDD4076977.1 DNA repair protein RecO [Bacilli bacterium]